MRFTFYFTLLPLFFISFSSICQTMTGTDIKDHMLIDLSKRVDRSVEEFEGSPYLKETFVKGKIFTSKKLYAEVPLRYNIYNDDMEFMQGDATYALYPEPQIVKVALGDEIYVVEKQEAKGKRQYGYLSRLDSGKVTLLSKKIVRFTDKQEPKALEAAGKPAKFTRAADLYYYKIGVDAASKVGSLKSFIESLPDKQDQMTEFAKKEKLSTRTEEDLLKLVKYYNSL
jgi:hypothetical protein